MSSAWEEYVAHRVMGGSIVVVVIDFREETALFKSDTEWKSESSDPIISLSA